nr:hypothetical protein CFP56_09052 [Quercus suber]
MSSTFRSHFRRTSQQEELALGHSRLPSSRSGTRSSDEEGVRQGKPAQQVSKLTKRASRTVVTSGKPERPGRTAAKPSAVVTASPGHAAASKRSSVTPMSDVQASRIGAGSSFRHNGLPPPPIMRTPSLVSGSSISTFDSPRSVGLRRKPSTIDKYAAQKKADASNMLLDGTTMHGRTEDYSELYDDSILGISLPPTSGHATRRPSPTPTTGVRSLEVPDGKEWSLSRNPSPLPSHVLSVTPSTFYTDSPFSHVPTPSSMSSYSSSVVAPTGPTVRNENIGPNSDQTKDSHRSGLQPVRESSTSSSNSTVKPSASAREVPRSLSAAPLASRPRLTTRSASRDKSSLPQAKNATVPVMKGDAKPRSLVRIPPELAHLNVEPQVQQPTTNKPLPPIRPSREGTPNLSGMEQPSPVVQSDLNPVYATYHKRTSSQETAASPPAKSRFGISSKSPSKHASPRVDSAISPPPSARTFARGPTPEAPAPEPRRLLRKDSPALASSSSTSKSHRFGIFSRKPKVEQSKPAEKPKREIRKGPVAGTGHEGYGRFGFRGRSGSTTSSADLRSPSSDSNASSVAPSRPDVGRKPSMGSRKNSITSAKDSGELDDFLKERLNPVILRGSGSTLSNVASSSDLPSLSIPTSSTASLTESFPKPQLLPSAMRHSQGSSPRKRPQIPQRMQSDSSEDDMTARYPSLATRRSIARLSRADSRSPVRIPAAIMTEFPPNPRFVDDKITHQSNLSRQNSTIPVDEEPVEGREGLWLRPHHSQTTTRSARKWNFLDRAQSSPSDHGSAMNANVPEQRSPSPLQQSESLSIAHLDLLDPVSPISLEEVEAIAQGNDTSAEDLTSQGLPPPRMVPYEGRHVSMLPLPTQSHFNRRSELAGSEKVSQIMSPYVTLEPTDLPPPDHNEHASLLPRVQVAAKASNASLHPHDGSGLSVPKSTPEMLSSGFMNTDNSPRQSRLSPIGRIPRVVSKRDRDRKLPDTSFSRPFVRNQPNPSVKPPGTLYNQIRELASPIEAGSHPVSITSTKSDGTSADPYCISYTGAPSMSTAASSVDLTSSKDFLAFAPPRKNSNVSYSSSSSSWMHNYAMPTQQADDPWNEYDELLDDMLPQRLPGSYFVASHSVNPLYVSSPSVPAPLHLGYRSPPPTSRLPSPPGMHASSEILSVPQQIARFMQPSMSPLTTPHSLSDFVERYDNRSTSTLFSDPSRNSMMQPSRNSLSLPNRLSTVSARGSSSSRNSRASFHSRSASLPEADARNPHSSVAANPRFTRDTQLLGIAEDDIDETAARANLRFGALMTSKWLSFGQVLFSPAHNEMRLADEPRVLVLDGLGSDWSYYVALSYPAAVVYNLGPAPVKGSSAWPGVNQKPPVNHKHYPHEAVDAAFPFPKGFFTAVVFRFPTATSEEAYNACVSECKRVLRPGGYLEVAVLDLDLMNMGNKARKAVRDLKTRMQFNDQSVSLRNMSDVLIRCIGRRGFEDVQRCVVGVPAAGRIPRSQDSNSDGSQTSSLRKNSKVETSDPEISFSDLLHDTRDSQYEPGKPNNDEGITKMVARVGRWWYSSCYEQPILQSPTSIWNDPQLLREAETQGTSFKLLICHAQKPTQTRRRTVSV